MKTIIISRKPEIIEELRDMAEEIPEMDEVGGFCDILSALSYVENHRIDLVILNMVMKKQEGMSLRDRLKTSNPDAMIIYIAGGDEQTGNIMCLHPITVLPEDFSREDIHCAVKTALVLRRQMDRKIYVRTFGHFDVFVEGQPIMFKSAKAKELLAFLVDRRGGTVTTDQMISVLWENRPNDESTQNLCSKLVKTLRRELEASGAEEMLVASRGNRRVDPDTFRCDLYEFLNGSERVREQYMGEYLLDYSWSENRTALLDRFLH